MTRAHWPAPLQTRYSNSLQMSSTFLQTISERLYFRMQEKWWFKGSWSMVTNRSTNHQIGLRHASIHSLFHLPIRMRKSLYSSADGSSSDVAVALFASKHRRLWYGKKAQWRVSEQWRVKSQESRVKSQQSRVSVCSVKIRFDWTGLGTRISESPILSTVRVYCQLS